MSSSIADMANNFVGWLFSVADRDGDGKLTWNDVRAGALQYLDKDGDGKISVEELEGGLVTVYDHAEALTIKLVRLAQPFKGAMTAAFGWFICFHGRHFTYTILFARAFRMTGWPVVRQAALELRDTYVKSRTVMKKELPRLLEARESMLRLQQRLGEQQSRLDQAKQSNQAKDIERCEREIEEVMGDMQALQQASSSFTALSKCVDVEKLQDIASGLYAGLLACLASAMSSSAAKLGVSANLTQSVTHSLKSTLLPSLNTLVNKMLPPPSPSSAVGPAMSPMERQQWINAGCSVVVGAVSVYLAHRFEGFTHIVANSLLGAELVVDQVSGLVSAASGGMRIQDTPIANALQYSLCGAGVYSQMKGGGMWAVVGGGSSEWKGLAGWLLWVPLYAEKWLQGCASVARGMA